MHVHVVLCMYRDDHVECGDGRCERVEGDGIKSRGWMATQFKLFSSRIISFLFTLAINNHHVRSIKSTQVIRKAIPPLHLRPCELPSSHPPARLTTQRSTSLISRRFESNGKVSGPVIG